MAALVLVEDEAERKAIAAYLRTSHEVTAAARADALDRDEPRPGSAEVVVLDWNAGGDGEREVRRIRGSDQPDAYVIALVATPAPSTVAAMYDAGVDDFVRRPLVLDELAARIEVPRRSEAGRIASRPRVSQGPAPSPALDTGGLAVLANMGRVVADDIGQMVGDLEVNGGWLLAGELRGACIPMSVPSQGVELRVSVVVESSLLRFLAEALLGDPDAPADQLQDMLREIANTAGGAVKRAAASQDIEVTTGLPVDEDHGVTQNEATRCWTAKIAGSSMQLGIIGEVLTRTPLRVCVDALQEGMVLSRDLVDDAGVLLLHGGTRVTSTARDRIASILGPSREVEVLPTGG